MKYEPLKFKFLPEDKIFCTFQIKRSEDEYDQYNFTTVDKPAPGLLNQSLLFRKYVLNLCELPESEEEIHKLEIKSFSFSWSGEKHIMGCTISASRKLSGSNSPLILNTPHKIEDFHADNGDTKQLLPRNMVNDIYELMLHINSFIDGEREQLDLFSELIAMRKKAG
ncbi:hypothetical protein ASZ90_004279 [hydrocarbon metagenome]|uniref:Uncharacterized protein n=1 Tax=hydrocarbon metagenome TaxID=938273 RepID=A0A0W8FYF5_9ZZZZ